METSDNIINRFTGFINSKQPFTFTKFGDGEIICMMQKFEHGASNCDHQSYSVELGNKLIESICFFSNKPNVFIGQWNFDIYGEYFNEMLAEKDISLQFVPYGTLLNIKDAPLIELTKLYGAIKKSDEPKLYICPEKINSAKSFLNCDILNIPNSEAFFEYENIKQQVLNSQHKIFLYSCGLMSKVLIKDIMEQRPDTTHIDIGSGLDNLFFGTTREHQIDKEELEKIYYFK